MPAYQRRVVDDELDELMPTETRDIEPLAGGLCGNDSGRLDWENVFLIH